MQGTVYPSSFRTHISHFIMLAPKEQDSSPQSTPGNQESTADDHTVTPLPAEGDIGDDRLLHLNAHSPNQQPMHPVIEEHATITVPIEHDEPKGDDTDLLYRIRGLYRLLDLINEQGSGGAGMIKVL